MAGLNVIGLFAPDWLVYCGQQGQPTCADATKAYKEMSEAAAKKLPAFTGTPASAPSTPTAAINNSAARFVICDAEFRGPGGTTRCH